MSQIRKAHTVEIIDSRLRKCEVEGNVDAMELIGIHDELSRVERKWLMKSRGEMNSAIRPGHTRPLSDAKAMNGRFDRLLKLIEAVLRKGVADEMEAKFLQKIEGELKARERLAEEG